MMFGVKEILDEPFELGFRDEPLRIAFSREVQRIRGWAIRGTPLMSVHHASDQDPAHQDHHHHPQ